MYVGLLMSDLPDNKLELGFAGDRFFFSAVLLSRKSCCLENFVVDAPVRVVPA